MVEFVTRPEVSVVIATYNVESYLERAVRSALDQTDVSVEVIIVDDCSADGTVAVAQSITDPRIKLICRSTNGGPGAARNQGIDAASAPWVAILDADDAFGPGRLSRCLALASREKAHIVIDNLQVLTEADGLPRPMYGVKDFGGKAILDLPSFIRGNSSFLGGRSLGYVKPLFALDFLNEHSLRYMPEIRIGEDYLLLSEALACGAKCAIEPEVGYIYTVRPGSISNRLSMEDINRIKSCDRIFLGRHKLSSAALHAQGQRTRGVYKAAVFTLLVDAIKAKNVLRALRIISFNPSVIANLSRPLTARLSRASKSVLRLVETLFGLNGRARLDIGERKTILLFYKEYEADRFVKYDRYLKRILRPFYHRLHHRQKKSGFAVSFELMRRSLENAGYVVVVNNYSLARHNPTYPVGLIGFPLLLENLSLPNPAVLGPSLFDHPMLAPHLFSDQRFKRYVVLAPWTKSLYDPVYTDRCFCWFAGIDTNKWPDMSGRPKTIDFLVYDKVRWDHALYQTSLIDPILDELEKRGLSYRVVRYKMHDHNKLRSELAQARGFLFLCEHETQGIAYQEAMSSNVPILAWDRGYWADPLWKKFSAQAPVASSVPFFSPECGETFADLECFARKLEKFMSLRDTYKPRLYVERELTASRSAQIYADEYFNIS